jgi:PDZ domain
MHRFRPSRPTTHLALAALVCLAAAPAWATDDDAQEIHKVVKTKIHCDSEDCADASVHAVFVDEDGNTTELGGDDVRWLDADGEPGKAMMQILHGALGGGFLGVGLTDLTPELRTHFGVPEGSGVMVSKVVDDSPAQRAGVQVGDIITLVDDETVGSGSELAHLIGRHEEGDTVVLEIWRDGRAQRLSATVDKRDMPGMMMHPRVHMSHGPGDTMRRRIEVMCKDGDCTHAHGEMTDFDCGGAEECEVKVMCKDGACTCTVNGEDTDCADIPGVDGD